MITRDMLVRWREAVTLAITSPAPEPSITIAMQEMYIEAKGLRRDNLKLLNSEDLIEMMAKFLRLSIRDHYLTPEMEEMIEEIDEICKQNNINLELDL